MLTSHDSCSHNRIPLYQCLMQSFNSEPLFSTISRICCTTSSQHLSGGESHLLERTQENKRVILPQDLYYGWRPQSSRCWGKSITNTPPAPAKKPAAAQWHKTRSFHHGRHTRSRTTRLRPHRLIEAKPPNGSKEWGRQQVVVVVVVVDVVFVFVFVSGVEMMLVLDLMHQTNAAEQRRRMIHLRVKSWNFQGPKRQIKLL